MRFIIIILIGFLCNNIVIAQRDTITFFYNKAKYNEIAGQHLIKLYNEESGNNIPIFSDILLSDKYAMEDLKIISIPIFYLKKKSYKCGDNIETLIFFNQDFLFQEVLIIAKDRDIKVGAIEIFDSYNKINQIKDSINNLSFALHGRPVYSDTKKVEKKLYKYMKKKPNVFVFMIKDLHGYWGVINGEIVKLVNDVFRLKGKNGSYFICENYGQEYINDIINDKFRIGYKYRNCSNCEINNNIQIVVIEQ